VIKPRPGSAPPIRAGSFSRMAWTRGAARTPSPDVRCGRHALCSLDAGCAPPSWLRWPATSAPGARAAPRVLS